MCWRCSSWLIAPLMEKIICLAVDRRCCRWRCLLGWMVNVRMYLNVFWPHGRSCLLGEVCRLWRTASMPLQLQASKEVVLMCSFSVGPSFLVLLAFLLLSRSSQFWVSALSFNVTRCRSKKVSPTTCGPTVNTGSESDIGGSQYRAVSWNVYDRWR